jgi:LysM repeat protein
MVIKRNTFFLILALIISLVGSSACERSASSPVINDSQVSNPTQVLEYFLAAATATAQAAQMGGVTVTPVDITATLSNNVIDLQETAVATYTIAAEPTEEIEPSIEPTIEPTYTLVVITNTPKPTKISNTPTPTKAKPTPTPTSTMVNTAAPTSQVNVPKTYILKKGEDLLCIARRFDIDISALLSTNGLSINQYVEAGLALTIPKNASSFNGSRVLLSHPDTYTVQSDDTIYSIACKYGDIYPESIAEANGIKLKNELKSGIVLQIP